MTIDERLEFLRQSTESLYATTALHSAPIAQLTGKMGILTDLMIQLEKKFGQVASVLGEISIVALNRERRLGKLDGGGETVS